VDASDVTKRRLWNSGTIGALRDDLLIESTIDQKR